MAKKIVTATEAKTQATPGNKAGGDPVATVKIRKKKVVKNRTFECPFAPMGKSGTAIESMVQRGGTTVKLSYSISLMNKQYVVPDDIKGQELEDLLFCLKNNGFVDVTTIPKKGVKYVKETNKYKYFAVHAMHTPKRPINGNIALVKRDENGREQVDKNGNQVTEQITIVDGTAVTNDKGIYEALIAAGFLPGGKEVINE